VVRLTSFEPNEQRVTTLWQRRLPLLGVLRGDRSLQALWKGRAAKAWRRAIQSVRPSVARSALKTIYLLITITVIAASHPHLAAQEVTTQAPPQASVSSGLPDTPGEVRYPEAEVVPPVDDRTTVVIESNGPQTKTGSVYTLDDDVKITYRDRIVRADHIEYDTDTGELVATGHLRVTGGPNDEDISASHGTMNLSKQTGRFYDVTGSVGMKPPVGMKAATVYSNSNPFLFTGRMVERTGPEEYVIYEGTVTSCQLPHPDWLLAAGKFNVDSEKASARGSIFHVMNIPLLYLPYVTHPVDAEQRQSGIEIPEIGNSSTKGIVLGEEFYWAINRSSDLTLGLDYLSKRGWQERSTFRYKGLGNDFATGHYSGLQDRGYYSDGVYVNQGGEDVTFLGRHDFSAHSRVVGDAEYLSSFAYREAFAESFNEAVSSDILSILYGVRDDGGYVAAVRTDRYQGLKMAAVAATPTTPAIPEQQVRIFHVPSLDFSSTEHEIGRSGLQWSLESSLAGLSRVEPGFSSGGLTARFDFHPEISYPFSADGWHLRASAGVRDTLYSRSQQTPHALDVVPVELPNGLNRADVEMEMDIRAPVVERTFDSAGVEKMFGHDVKHTIEPEFTYRYVGGVNNFLNVLRFDDVDVVSDTNELEYGATQRLFLRPLKDQHCAVTEEEVVQDQAKNRDDPNHASVKKHSGCGDREWISWRVTQKYFFNQNFGGAVIDGRRNIFDTTLNLSGIAFLTEPRAISPLISRLRVRTSANLDVEWDFDLDTGAKKFTSNNVLVDAHQGNIFGGMSYARLNAPGRFYTDGVTSGVSNFNQIRLLLGYGSPTKAGLAVAGNLGLNLSPSSGACGATTTVTCNSLLQYGAVQTSYNWDCCGFSVEVRKYELGSVRNELEEKFSITLVNIGTAGNLRRALNLF
jgi:LPS-assembly protein